VNDTCDRSRLVLQAAPLAILAADPGGRILSWNPGAERLFGWTEQEVLGRVCPAVPEDGIDDFQEMIQRVLRAGPVTGVVRRRRKKDGSLIEADVSLAPLAGGDGTTLGVVALLEDVTGRRQVRVRCLERARAAQEDERRRLASQLHDGLCQSLTALMLRLHALEGVPTLAEARAQARGLLEFTAAVAEEARLLVRSLRPVSPDDLGLAAALARHLEEYQQAHGIVVDSYMPGLAEDRLPPAVETALYRVVQEALSNTARHARARHASVVLERKPGFVRLIVEDDGVGFDYPAAGAGATAGDGFGLPTRPAGRGPSWC
jgi:PAS domain S-box-containing protein